MRSSDFIFDCVNLLHYNCHKIKFEAWLIIKDSPDCIKNKRTTVSHINDDDK